MSTHTPRSGRRTPRGGFTVPYRWAAGAVDVLLVAGLIRSGLGAVQAVAIGIGLLLVPWLLTRDVRR
ncbi:hypothetical protein ACGF13_28090 [Kitasatospora sp. NPDC048286]|uniref:hypothetical protein n=1 Tax=unclassified Kitasatospora TaxID=2633591 RepID=UPI00371D7007